MIKIIITLLVAYSFTAKATECGAILTSTVSLDGKARWIMRPEPGSVFDLRPDLLLALERIRYRHPVFYWRNARQIYGSEVQNFVEDYKLQISELSNLAAQDVLNIGFGLILKEAALRMEVEAYRQFQNPKLPFLTSDLTFKLFKLSMNQRAILNEVFTAMFFRGHSQIEIRVRDFLSEELSVIPRRIRRELIDGDIDILNHRPDGSLLWIEVKNNFRDPLFWDDEVPAGVGSAEEKFKRLDEDLIRQATRMVSIVRAVRDSKKIKLSFVFRYPISNDVRQKLIEAGVDFVSVIFPYGVESSE